MPMICPGSSRAAWILPHASVDATLKAYQCSYEVITKQTELDMRSDPSDSLLAVSYTTMRIARYARLAN